MSAGDKSSKYASKGEEDSMESLSEKLTQDLRKHIRLIHSYPILSEPWKDMAKTFGRMATISDMESKLAASKDGTLWETEEQALRFLLEDGKLNVCLRGLVEFKSMQRAGRAAGEVGPIFENITECDQYEKGIGVVLKNVWNHVESLQTTDLANLVQYIGNVLDDAVTFPDIMMVYCRAGDLHQRQEIMVMYYIASMARYADEILESRFMPWVRQHKIFMKVVHVLNLYHSEIISSHVLKGAEALALLAETEDFKTNWDAYIETTIDGEALVALKAKCLSAFQDSFENKRKIRPLIDTIDKAKRKFRL